MLTDSVKGKELPKPEISNRIRELQSRGSELTKEQREEEIIWSAKEAIISETEVHEFLSKIIVIDGI